MAKEMKLEDSITILQTKLAKGELTKEQVTPILNALNSLGKSKIELKRSQNPKAPPHFRIAKTKEGTSLIAMLRKGAPELPNFYDENSICSVLGVIMANNGKELEKPPATRKWGKKLSSALIALLVAALLTTGISANLNKEEDVIDNTNTEESSIIDSVDYKLCLESRLRSINEGYNALLHNYAALQGSEDLKDIDALVKKQTGFKTMEEYLRFIQKEYAKAQAFYEVTSNKNKENNAAFKEIYEHLTDLSITYNINSIRMAGFDIISNTTSRLNKEFSSFQLNAENEMGE